jgi:hypothetical protein
MGFGLVCNRYLIRESISVDLLEMFRLSVNGL